MTQDMVFRRGTLALAAALVLTACGGGSQGAGGFTLDKRSLQFSGVVGGDPIPAQTVEMTITDTNVAYVGARWKDGIVPSWALLQVEPVTGTKTVDIVVSIATSGLAAGTYNAVAEVGTSDEKGNVLGIQQIAITCTFVKVLLFDSPAQHVAATFGYPSTSVLPIAVKNTSGKRWQVTSDRPWLTVPSSVQTGGTSFQATVDTSEQAVGSYTGTLTLSNADDAAERATLAVTLDVAAAKLSISVGNVVLGGANGLALDPQPVSFSLDTGPNAYPWTATVSTTDGVAWLATDVTSGNVSATPSTLNLSFDRAKVRGGTYTGLVKLSVNVLGSQLQASIPVTLKVAAEGLFVATNGVALSSFPTAGELSREVPVTTTTGRAGIAWSASSSASWLKFTTSGKTGENLVFTADPTGLAANQEYLADLTLTSSDPTIEWGEKVRVGLWVGSSDPVKVSNPYTATNAYYLYTVNDPVEPYEFINSSGTDVAVYNVYTGALVKTFTGVGPKLGEMTVSSDGTTLFVVDTSNFSIKAIRIADGTVLQPFPLTSDYMSYPMGILYARPNGHPVLLTTMTGLVFDVGSRNAYTATLDTMVPGDTGGVQIAVTPDGRHVAMWGRPGYSSWDEVHQDTLEYSALTGQVIVTAGKTITKDLYLVDAAITPDGSRIYVADYDFQGFDPSSGTLVQTIQQPSTGPYTSIVNNITLLPNGDLLGAATWDPYSTRGSTDIWRYNPQGMLQGSMVAGIDTTERIIQRTLRVSGDGLRVTPVTNKNESVTLYFENLP